MTELTLFSLQNGVSLGVSEDCRNLFNVVFLLNLMIDRVNARVLAILDLTHDPQLWCVHGAWGAAYLG